MKLNVTNTQCSYCNNTEITAVVLRHEMSRLEGGCSRSEVVTSVYMLSVVELWELYKSLTDVMLGEKSCALLNGDEIRFSSYRACVSACFEVLETIEGTIDTLIPYRAPFEEGLLFFKRVQKADA